MSTAERVNHKELSDNYVLQRSISAYVSAAKLVNGKVLEIGTGSGYGIDYLAPCVKEFVTIDKFQPSDVDFSKYHNVLFQRCTVPPLPFQDNEFDFVVSFQVIEHIKDDKTFVKEIYRVLKPGGKFIVTTPNILTTLTRNPWHIREYTKEELQKLLANYFSQITMLGVYGNEKVMKYYEHNKKSVQQIMKWDVFDLQHRLPAWMLRIPYDILNRLNRRKLLKENPLTKDITVNDFYIDKADDTALDLFYIAEK
ncbi:MAG: class I SAM-dependent methyltransferase [Bacteroidetes bacterium]|nr:MAG: class I SAM-dependent methyltransferase [Bacteroidota bacterium]